MGWKRGGTHADESGVARGASIVGWRGAFCGYYLNELLMHLLPREDAHEQLYDSYASMLKRLSSTPLGKVNEADLRGFEKTLLQELGYGLTLRHDSHGTPISADAYYTYRMEQGPVRLAHDNEAAQVVIGKTLLDMDAENFSDARSRQESKALMRTLLAYYLAGKELETRKLFKEMQEL
jgi:DNA repair protein RecO (recombination protein O)